MPSALVYRQMLLGHLNAPELAAVTSYPSTNATSEGKKGFADGRIDDQVRLAAAEVLGLVASSPENAHRRDLVATAPAVSGNLLPTHVGPLGAVKIDGRPGRLVAADMVQWLLEDPLGLTETAGCYGLDGDRIYFVGSVCTVDVVQLPDPVDPATVPVEYADAVLAIALEYLFAFEGEHLDAAAHYAQIADRFRMSIPQNQALPEVPPYRPR